MSLHQSIKNNSDNIVKIIDIMQRMSETMVEYNERIEKLQRDVIICQSLMDKNRLKEARKVFDEVRKEIEEERVSKKDLHKEINEVIGTIDSLEI